VLQVMGEDGLFFRTVARLHPRYHTPNIALLLLTGWSIVLVLSGSYGQLLDYATFGDWLACAVGVSTLFWYRRHDGDVPFRVPGYPAAADLHRRDRMGGGGRCATARATPASALIMAAGVPVYLVWRALFSRSAPLSGSAGNATMCG
jgi:APA family basic amino acid/polyamine antiporter